ncbi:MAG: hypothetical protein AAGF73_08855 [Actinomycetota bacterium]
MNRSRPRLGLLGAHLAPFAAAADLAGWLPGVIAGAPISDVASDELATARGLPVLDVDEAVERASLDIAIVGTEPGRRVGDAYALLERGVHVLLVPDLGLPGADRLVTQPPGPAVLALAAPLLATATAGKWLAMVAEATDVEHLTGRAGPDDGPTGPLRWQLLALLSLAASAAGWDAPTHVDRNDAHISIGYGPNRRLSASSTPPTSGAVFAAQAAGPAEALVLDVIPHTQVERNGQLIARANADEHPAVRFGTAPLLRRFVADLSAGRRPRLDGQFLATLAHP